MFLHGSPTPQASWTVIDVGIRLAQDVGAHRKKVYNPARTVEEELWTEACRLVSPFSSPVGVLYAYTDGLCRVLVALDRFISSALGRPCALHDEE